MPKNIEVEIRSFISKEKYNKLKKYFDKKAKFISSDEQETHYFDCDQDLRIQKNQHYSKVWLKKWEDLHDDAREEIEIKFNKDNFPEAQKLFNALGHQVEIKWFRKRLSYEWEDINVCLDHTRGYGFILELEKMASENDKAKALSHLKSKLSELNIDLTPKEEFSKKYEYYKENWQKLV